MGRRLLAWLLREFGAGLASMGQYFGALTPPECYGRVSWTPTEHAPATDHAPDGPDPDSTLSSQERAQWRGLVRQLKTPEATDRHHRPH
ncbi:hypothetical protein ABZX99_11165 [Streptomyces antibioticus]|uniref:hypothetical protein n=1 Tax=Streptomyces antibioticus TaxID=1890 RepID=UPI00196094E7|nr:hypothetical protein [Streptomyces sp. S9]